ncbi:MAG: GNAT family N-acetyltransferase [Chloroflexota bacterium]
MTETKQRMEQIVTGPMEPQELGMVVDVLARALRDNPSFIGMFGPKPGRRLRSTRILCRMILSGQSEPPTVARLAGVVVGAAAVSPPQTCFYCGARWRHYRINIAGRGFTIESEVSFRELLRLLRLGLPALHRAGVMGRLSAVHDPQVRHWHVELVGVEPDLQGRGIGGTLMEAALRGPDAAGEPASVDTDTTRNVEFYRRLGFEVTATEEPLGVKAWYMERPAVLGR